MTHSCWQTIVDKLQEECKVEFEEPLSDFEVEATEKKFGFRFPPDLREFLQTALPVSDRFVNWRNEREDVLRDRLRRPLEGMLFDVEYNSFWLREWGEKPKNLAAAVEIVKTKVAVAPILIPIYAHRMMPDRPFETGNPVFSVHQTDIIVYGLNLRDYFIHEFFVGDDHVGLWPIDDSVRQIEFWDLERFHDIRWDERGSARFDNRRGDLPKSEPR